MNLFPNYNPNLREIQYYFNPPKGLENRAFEFVNNMSIVHRLDGEKEFFKRKIAFCNYEWCTASRSFHDGQMRPHINQRFLESYIEKHHLNLTAEYYYHALGAGLLQGVYMIYAGQPNKIYVGSVFGPNRTFSDRWKEHRYHLDRKDHHCKRLQSAFDKTSMFCPIIFWATNASYLPNGKTEATIKAQEEFLITSLWESIYNKRRF